jgi:hypothetical protein
MINKKVKMNQYMHVQYFYSLLRNVVLRIYRIFVYSTQPRGHVGAETIDLELPVILIISKQLDDNIVQYLIFTKII